MEYIQIKLRTVCIRYLHQQWDKKSSVKKRTGETSGNSEDAKKPRLETLPDTSNTASGVSMSSSITSRSSSGPPPAYPG